MIGEEQIEFEPNEEESAMKLEKAPVELIPALVSFEWLKISIKIPKAPHFTSQGQAFRLFN